ncbi:2TM domain-containing protein [Flavobacterium sp. MK4S-17]|uniref:2TM domain-containing protein n=1 Tax=Flavobacterium sp. MK4S-17 TaxID=2543737 RepID=UPI001356FE18|nr:2TM domain-containing protein [Flavobacterium sp. MK4S-17]
MNNNTLRTVEEQLRYDRARKKVKSIKGFYMHFTAYLVVNIILLLMHWEDMKPGEEFFTFQAFSTAIFWGIGVLFHALGTFSSNILLGNNWEERKIKEMMERNQGNRTKWE